MEKELIQERKIYEVNVNEDLIATVEIIHDYNLDLYEMNTSFYDKEWNKVDNIDKETIEKVKKLFNS